MILREVAKLRKCILPTGNSAGLIQLPEQIVSWKEVMEHTLGEYPPKVYTLPQPEWGVSRVKLFEFIATHLGVKDGGISPG